MNRGYIRLWRKSLDAGWIRNHKLWAFWSYCLLKASYKEFDAIVGLQVVHLMPGEFIFGRIKAAKATGLSEQEIRTIVAFLRRCGNLTIRSTNKFSIITIVNWSTYQGDEKENNHQINQPLTNKEPHTNIKTLNKKTSCEILSEISELAKRYPDQETINQAFQAISSTRKSNRIAGTVKCSILKTWERHPVESVMAGIRTYLEKGYHGQGKDEKYLLGIIRNLKPESSMAAGQFMKSTGSPLYDAYLRGEIKVSQEATTP